MLRTWVAALAIGVCSVGCVAQQASGTPSRGTASVPQRVTSDGPSPSRKIEDCEARIRQAEAAHADVKLVAALYHTLGVLYQGVGNLPRSEAAARKEVELLRDASPQDQADALNRLAAVHVEMKKMREAEKERMDVLNLREKTGDSMAIALAWSDLANLYVRMWRFDDALTYARKAAPVFADMSNVDVHDQISLQETMAYALCGAHRCAEAIPVLRTAIDLTTSKLGSESLDTAVAEYLIGYAYSQNGQTDLADRWMADGIGKMKPYRAYGRAPYLHAITQYAQFLRASGRTEEAAAAERDIRTANSTVEAAALVQ